MGLNTGSMVRFMCMDQQISIMHVHVCACMFMYVCEYMCVHACINTQEGSNRGNSPKQHGRTCTRPSRSGMTHVSFAE